MLARSTGSAWPIPAVLLAMACTAPSGDSTGETVAAIPVVTVIATDYAYEAPDTITAGVNEFRLVNRGADAHSVAIVRLDDGRTLPEYIHAYREANRTRSARPAWATFRGGAGLFTPGEATAIVDLEPGSYALVCFVPGPSGDSHLLEHEQAHAFVVRPRAPDAPAPSAPEAAATLSMRDFSFELSEPIEPGRQTIRVENAGVEPHHVLLFRLAPGRTLDDYNAWLEGGMQGEGVATYVGGMDVLSQGKAAWFEVDLPPGDYVLVCLVAGRDEVPHIAKGMIRHVRVG